MSPLIPYLALAIFPLAFVLGFSFNPIEFSWTFNHGTDPMPEALLEKAATISRYANFLGNALILGLVVVLCLRNSITAPQLGLHLSKWQTTIAVGTIMGTSLVAAQAFTVKLISRRGPNPLLYNPRRGSIFLWVVIIAVGAFSEEIWIALCLVTLRTTGHSVFLSVAMTATVFAIVHYGYRFGMVAVGLKGAMSALIFLWTGSLMATFLFHFIGNLGSLYRSRHARTS